MSLVCPSCGRTIAIKDARPGRFRVPCPECGRPFRLDVGPPPEAIMTVRPIEAEGPSQAVPPPDPLVDARRIGARMAAAMGQRLGWAWRALTDRRATVGGTLILRDLGRTSLGTVGRGRQVLLGRDVLVRTLPADWGAAGPVGRATAYRLAQVSSAIVHPNLVDRLEFGEDRGRRFAIEEVLEGPTLAALATHDDWSGGDAALAPILHAARGLLAAHDLGIAHGDPSAEHIWLDEGGGVKLAGIGLTTMPGTETRDGAEPFALSAARDVQALGHALAALAKPRQTGLTAGSDGVREVVGRMKAAGTADGFRDLAEAVRAMEAALGVGGPGAVTPLGEEETRYREIVRRYRDLPLAGLRARLVMGFFGVSALFTLLFALGGRFALAGGVAGLCVMTVAIYGLVRAGLGQGPGLLGKVRELILGGRRADWLTVLAAVVVGLVVLFALGWLAGWIALGVVAAVFAVGFAVAIDAPIERDREAPLAEAGDLLRSMRARGVAELTIREFASKAGDRSGGLFEALFGLVEARRAQLAWGDAHAPRFGPGAWRYRVLDWIDARLRDRREARARAMFESLEESALIAQKVNEMTARRKSRRIAEALLVVTREVRAASLSQLTPARPDTMVVAPRPVPDLIREAVETPDRLLTSTWSDEREAERGPNPLLRLLAGLAGPRARFLLGGLLCAAFLLWADQVGIISSTEIRERAERAIAERDVGHLKDVNVDVARIHTSDEPLRIPGVPEALTRLVSGYGVGAAGLILIVSALSAGSRIALVALPAAAIAWFGPRLGIPAIGPLAGPAVAAAAGAGLLVLGMLWEGRRSS